MLLERQHKSQWGVWVSTQGNDRLIRLVSSGRENSQGKNWTGHSVKPSLQIMLQFLRLGASLADVAILLLHAEVNLSGLRGRIPDV